MTQEIIITNPNTAERLDDFSDHTRNLGELAIKTVEIYCRYANTGRMPRLPEDKEGKSGKREDDAQHSWSVEGLAIEILPELYPHLDPAEVRAFAHGHDLVEIETGDVATFNLAPEQLAKKNSDEKTVLQDFLATLPPEMAKTLEQYERQDTAEARYVRAVDKILPVLVDYVGKEQGVRVIEEDYGITCIEELQKAHSALIQKFTQRFGAEFPELVDLYAYAARRFEQRYVEIKQTTDPITLPERPTQHKEIERKFIVDPTKIPFDISQYPHKELRQKYISTTDNSETRIRSFGDGKRFELTVKSVGTISRDEQTIKIDEATFEALWNQIAGKYVEKTRYYIPYEDPETNEKHTIELDLYRGHLEGLVTTEIEFSGRETEASVRADTFCAPSWFGEDVSEDARFKNRSLASARNGLKDLGDAWS